MKHNVKYPRVWFFFLTRENNHALFIKERLGLSGRSDDLRMLSERKTKQVEFVSELH